MITHQAAAFTERQLAVADDTLVLYEWGTPGEVTVVLNHATGFHGRCWNQAIAHLPADWHVVALDQRGHGQSTASGPLQDWQIFADDLVAVLDILGVQHAIGVGHSMGGHALTCACTMRPDAFDALLLIDPVILDPELAQVAHEGLRHMDEHPVARRKSVFPSWQAMYERFRERDPYELWDDAVLQDYCRYGVLPADEGVTLACAPQWEAQVYTCTNRPEVVGLLDQIHQPVRVLRGRRLSLEPGEVDFKSSPTWPGLAQALPRGEDVHLPELTHFIPMQRPEIVYEHLATLLNPSTA